MCTGKENCSLGVGGDACCASACRTKDLLDSRVGIINAHHKLHLFQTHARHVGTKLAFCNFFDEKHDLLRN